MLIKVDNVYIETANVSHIVDLREDNAQILKDSQVAGAKTRIVMNSQLYIDTASSVEELVYPHVYCAGVFNYGKLEEGDI